MLSFLCILGGLLFAYAAIPQTIKTIRAGKSLGTPNDISIVVLSGTVIMYTYLTAAHGFDIFLTINYVIEALSWGILLFYGVFKKHVAN
jgi:hypothetical protein